MDDFQIQCPHCNYVFEISFESTEEIKCPECNELISIDMLGDLDGIDNDDFDIDTEEINLIASNIEEDVDKDEENAEKICPACGENIKLIAKKCRFCGEFFIKCNNCDRETVSSFSKCHICGESLSQLNNKPAISKTDKITSNANSQKDNTNNENQITIKCNSCGANINVLKPGTYKCSNCESIFTVLPNRQVQFSQQDMSIQPFSQFSQKYPGQSQNMNNDMEYKRAALSKSYVGSAFISWIMYFIGFYLIGFILNVVFLSSANRFKKETGISPSGKGCLSFLLFVHFTLPLIILLLIGFSVGFSMEEIGDKLKDIIKDIKRALK